MSLWFWILIVIAIPVVLMVGLIVYRLVKVTGQNRKLSTQRQLRIGPLLDALESGRGLDEEQVLPFANDLATRWTTIDLLKERGLLELLPADKSIEWAAEGNLVQWLEFPTELDAIPDEIEHVKRVSIDVDDGKKVLYHVFKYRVDEPHWASSIGWMLGVVGPYFDDSNYFDWPTATFSRVSSKFDEVTPEDEALWVHQNIANR